MGFRDSLGEARHLETSCRFGPCGRAILRRGASNGSCFTECRLPVYAQGRRMD